MKTHTARTPRGACAHCHEQVEPGQVYANSTRYATEADRKADLAFYSGGWRVKIVLHNWCIDPYFDNVNRKVEKKSFWTSVEYHREPDPDVEQMRKDYHADREEGMV